MYADGRDACYPGRQVLYELLLRRYNQRIFRVVRSVIPNDLEAEDVLQDAWVHAFEHLDQYAARASFATWVTRIAFYEALGRIRKQSRLTALESSDGSIMPQVEQRASKLRDPEQQAMLGELGHLLESAVDRLPATYRSVFVLRGVENLSTAETAGCLGLSEEAVKTRFHRSRALLKRDLEDRIGQAATQAYAFQGARCDRVVATVLRLIAGR